MNKSLKRLYRVECNFGCKYFKSEEKARAYFERKADKHLDVELWIVTYSVRKFGFSASQKLLEYSATALPKC